MKLPYIFYLSLTLLAFWQCSDPPNYPKEPVIKFVKMTKDTMLQSSFPTDSMTVTFSFTDGDGNIGSPPNENFIDVFLWDKRDGFLANQYRIPPIPSEGVADALSGEISIIVFTSCCITNAFPPCYSTPTIPTDTLVYQIQIMDRDSNRSNIIETLPIILKCDE